MNAVWRAVLSSLVLATGCDLIFPLEAPAITGDGGDVDSPTVDGNPEAPIFVGVSVAPQPTVGSPSVVTASLMGTPNAMVHYLFDTSVGSFVAPMGTQTLDGVGTGKISLDWDPPANFSFETVTGRISYDTSLASFNESEPLQFAVRQEFGHPDPLGDVLGLAKDKLLAFPITVGPGAGTLVKLGITASGGLGLLGLYDSNAGAPGARVAAVPAFVLTGSPQELDVMTPLAPGVYWLAFLGNATTNFDFASAAVDSPPPIFADALFASALPTTFPPARSPLGMTWRIHATVAP